METSENSVVHENLGFACGPRYLNPADNLREEANLQARWRSQKQTQKGSRASKSVDASSSSGQASASQQVQQVLHYVIARANAKDQPTVQKQCRMAALSFLHAAIAPKRC